MNEELCINKSDRKLESFNKIGLMAFLISIIVLPRSYVIVKLFFLSFFIIGHIIRIIKRNKLTLFTNVFVFYSFVTVAGLYCSVVGYINGAPIEGIKANFRLYVVWGIAYFIIITLVRSSSSVKSIHTSLIISAFLIFIINMIGLFNTYTSAGVLNSDFIKEMDMSIGIHDGYVQIMSHNIASLFFIVPYLINLQFRSDSRHFNSFYTRMCLLVCLVLVALSGRRALWLSILFTPLIILIWSYITKSYNLIKSSARRFIWILTIVSLLVTCLIFILQVEGGIEWGFLKHLKAAFSSEDERSIQKGYLINSFLQYPIFGSGFGMNAGYLRNQEEPWLYELTYYQILFNFGIVGVLFLTSFLFIYLYLIIVKIKKLKNDSVFASSIMTGFFSFLLAIYSNPYFGSFDFLIYIAMLPYLSTFKAGYNLDK